MQRPAEIVNNEIDDVQEQVEVTEINCNSAWIYSGGRGNELEMTLAGFFQMVGKQDI